MEDETPGNELPAADDARASGSQDDQHQQQDAYSPRVQRRISKLSRLRHEAEGRENAANQRAAAAEAENRVLRQRHQQADAAAITNAEEVYKQRAIAARQKLAEAHEKGDTSAVADATEELADAKAELKALEIIKRQRPQPAAEPDNKNARRGGNDAARDDDAGRREPTRRQETDDDEPDDETADWMERNPWFQPGTKERASRRMTDAALAIHDRLVARGVKPATPDYFRKIDREMAEEFPDSEYFRKDGNNGGRQRSNGADREDGDEAGTKPTGTPVSSAARDNSNRGSMVRLNADHKDAAAGMGLSVEQYAAGLKAMREKGKIR